MKLPESSGLGPRVQARCAKILKFSGVSAERGGEGLHSSGCVGHQGSGVNDKAPKTPKKGDEST